MKARFVVWFNPHDDYATKVVLHSGERRASEIFFSMDEDGSILVHSKNLDAYPKELHDNIDDKRERDLDSSAATEVLKKLGLTRDSQFNKLFNHATGHDVIPEIRSRKNKSI